MPSGKSTDLAHLSLIDFNDHIADPGRYSGGGSVSAAAATTAASLVLLVLYLNRRSNRNRDVADQIDSDIARVRKLQTELTSLVSDDADILSRLMDLHQSSDRDKDSAYRAALVDAAAAPLEIAEKCIQLLDFIEVNAPRASRFTIADLGAAASISAACAKSSLLMTDINVAILERLPDPPEGTLTKFDERLNAVLNTVDCILDRILNIVRSKLGKDRASVKVKSS